MCDVTVFKNKFQVIFVVLVLLFECNGYSVLEQGKTDEKVVNETNSKQNLPTSNVQTHYNETNQSYITTITLDIDFVHNTTASSVISHDPQPFCSCYCGLGNRKHRIVGGNVTRVNEYPWITAMFRRGKFYCGGTLITTRHMLTAAHCVYGFNPRDLRVILGEHDRDTNSESTTYERTIKSAKPHPGFDLTTFNNDVAVVEFDKPVPLGGSVRTACLPQNEVYDYTGREGIIAGWGRVTETKPTSGKLRHVTVPIMSMEACRQSGYIPTRITENMICAGYEKGKKDACQGDSGGPMVVETARGNMEIAGIVSWGRGCARPNYPGIYTKVVNYLSWIQEQVGNECYCARP